jgi:hypothetical protein
MLQIKDLILKFNLLLTQMESKGEPMGTNNPFNKLSRDLNISYAGSKILPPKIEFYNTSPVISYGLGRFSSIPWIVFTNYNQEVMKGIYPVLLYYLSHGKVLLCYGVSETNEPEYNWDNRIKTERKRVSDIIENPEKYGNSFVDKIYDLKNINDSLIIDQIANDLAQIINNFHAHMNEKGKPHFDSGDLINEILDKSTEVEISEISKSLQISKLEAHKKVYELFLSGKIEIGENSISKLVKTLDEINYNTEIYQSKFPFELTNWGANKPTAVRIPFSNQSGRPAGKVIKNKLINTLDDWINNPMKISNILLIGGPGNGKTDALEYLMEGIITRYSLNPNIKSNLSKMVSENRRSLEIEISNSPLFPFKKIVAIPEASTGTESLSKEQALFADFSNYQDDNEVLYISCINRGILEDLKSHAVNIGSDKIVNIIDEINQATKGEGHETWPINSQEQTAVWFMDIESLFDKNNEPTPSQQIMEVLVNPEKWDWYKGSLDLIEKCPLYDNFLQISSTTYSNNLNSILRNYELITENKLNFRNYFSLLSSLFSVNNGDGTDPVKMVIQCINKFNSSTPREYEYIKSLFTLSFASYSLRLFRDWDDVIDDFSYFSENNKFESLPLLKNFLKLFDDNIIRSFLSSYQSEYERKFIKQLNLVLDPYHSDNSKIIQITEAFSVNIKEGYNFVKSDLNFTQSKFLEYLIMIEDEIKASQLQSTKNSVFERLIQKLRSFGAQFSTRIIGTKEGITKDFSTLEEYNKLHDNFIVNKSKLNRMFKGITKSKDIFPLHSFGQPKPDDKNSIVIRYEAQGTPFNIKAIKTDFNRAAQSGVFFEFDKNKLNIPLTYNLYKALSEIDSGVNKNSVNANINALIERMESLLYSQFLHVDPIEYDSLKLVFGKNKNINLEDLHQI